MKPNTVLVSTGCDLKRLPLDASEVFLLSRLDGLLTLEEIGEIAGFDFDRARRLAERLIILGAAKPLGPKTSLPPAPAAGVTGVRRRFDPRLEQEEGDAAPRVETLGAKPKPPAQPQKRRSTKSLKAQRQAARPSPAIEGVCELDPEMQAKIHAFDAKLKAADHYTALGVERDADKKEIKRAYFALAATWHPDRFFGKKLGALRAPLERVFVRLTEANEALGTRARREAYDATLPPLETRSAAPAPPAARPPEPEPAPAPAPPKERTLAAPIPRHSPTPRRVSKRLRKSQLMGAVQSPPAAPVPTDDKLRKLQAQAKDLAGRVKAEPWVKAAEEAIRSNDILGAANNYRLALQMHEDPVIREKLDAIDRHSRDLRAEKYIVRARAAERGEHWADAAEHYVRANDARKDAATAERAAYCLMKANGDLRQAAQLAEHAVAAVGRNADYRLTLAEIFLASKLLVRAKDECDAALELQPENARARALASAIKKG